MRALMAERRDRSRMTTARRRCSAATRPSRRAPDTAAPRQRRRGAGRGARAAPDVEPLEPDGRAAPVADAPSDEARGVLEPAPAVAPEDAWLTELAPDVDEAELASRARGDELAR